METITLDMIVGQTINGDVYMVDHIYRNDNGMGAIGSVYRPVYIEEYTDATSEEGLQRHLSRWWTDARRRGDERGIGEFAAALYSEKGLGIIWDEGDRSKADRAREYTGLSLSDAPLFTCCGGGKCFSSKHSWIRVDDAERLFRLLDVTRERIDGWEYFVNRM